MLWKSYFLEFEANPEVHQWNELLSRSPWDFVEAPQWADADEETSRGSALEEVNPGNGHWETNPMTGVKIWVPSE
jgi:hypothetical protein